MTITQDTSTQLVLFPDEAVTGTGIPRPWPLAEEDIDDIEAETGVSPDQIAFDQDEEPEL